MYFALTLGIIGGLIFPIQQYFYYKPHKRRGWKELCGDLCAYLGMGLLIGGLVCLLTGILMVPVTAILASKEECVSYNIASTEKIVAVQDNIETSGTFFLGSGVVDGKVKYTYAVENEEGISIRQKDADYCYIKYDNDNPRIERMEASGSSKVIRFFIVKPFLEDYYVIYCPEGTVRQDYKVDLSN